MIGVTGKNSTIAQAFLERYWRDKKVCFARLPKDLSLSCSHYLLCAGVLVGKKSRQMSADEIADTFWVNYIDVVQFCDYIFSYNPKAKVCVVGSMSGIAGSYDDLYAGSKAALHLYVQTKKLEFAQQQLFAIAPTVIEDSGMTQRRRDLVGVIERGKQRRRHHWITAAEVAHMIHSCFNNSAICNTVIQMTGGNW